MVHIPAVCVCRTVLLYFNDVHTGCIWRDKYFCWWFAVKKKFEYYIQKDLLLIRQWSVTDPLLTSCNPPTLRTTSCLTSLSLHCWPVPSWPETGQTPGASGRGCSALLLLCCGTINHNLYIHVGDELKAETGNLSVSNVDVLAGVVLGCSNNHEQELLPIEWASSHGLYRPRIWQWVAVLQPSNYNCRPEQTFVPLL